MLACFTGIKQRANINQTDNFLESELHTSRPLRPLIQFCPRMKTLDEQVQQDKLLWERSLTIYTAMFLHQEHGCPRTLTITQFRAHNLLPLN